MLNSASVQAGTTAPRPLHVRPRAAVPAWLPNLALFYAGWWALVLSAALERPALGMTVVLATLAWHLARVRPQASEVGLVAMASLVGLVVESLFQASGWVVYAAPGPVSILAPLWLVALWVNFALTLNVALRPLQRRLGLAAVLGALGGPLAYLGGASLGALHFAAPIPALAALALVWALATPTLLVLARRLDARG